MNLQTILFTTKTLKPSNFKKVLIIKSIRFRLSNPDISLILMDMRMPGMNGIEKARKIRELNVDVPMLAQTASLFMEEHYKFPEAGFNGYILKPIDKDVLIKKLKQLLKGFS